MSATNRGYLRGIAEEFNESTNAIRKELNQLSEAGYLIRAQQNNRIYYSANTDHPLFTALQNLVRTYLGVDETVDNILDKAGDIKRVILVGDYAKGVDSGTIEILVEGDDIDSAYLLQLSGKTQNFLGKRIALIYERPEGDFPQIVLYQSEY